MTEAEYVQTIRDAAAGYIEVIRDPSAQESGQRIRRWWAITEKLSPHTVIALCDAWLEKQGAEAASDARSEPAAGEGPLSGI